MENPWNRGCDVEDEVNTLLIVHGIHPALTKEALKNQFMRFGEVLSTNVFINSKRNPMGFVQMHSVRDCAAAIAGLNGRAPLHWTVRLSAAPAERRRRRRLREEERLFEEEMRPVRAAKLREMEEYEKKMLQLTREFADSLEADEDQPTAEIAELPADSSSTDSAGGGWWPAAEGQQPCSVCTAPTSGYCHRCRIPYCSSHCQSADWETHRHSCRQRPEPQLVVSVDGTAGPTPVRSVQLGRGDQPRPVPAAAAAPLRRPHAGGDGADSAAGPAPAAADQLGPVELLLGRSYQVRVSYADDPSAVYLRLLDRFELVAAMEAELQRQVAAPPAGAPPPPPPLTVGQRCAAWYQGAWYRAELLAAAADGRHRVHFIDWGNTEPVSAADVRPLPARLAAAPPQAVRAALPWRPAGADGCWSRRQLDGLASLDGQPLTACVVADEPAVSVALFNADGKSALSVMGEGVVAAEEACQLPPPAQLRPDVNHVVLPTSMVHPQMVTGQLRDAALYRPYCQMVETLQTSCQAAGPLSVVPAAGSPVSVLAAPTGAEPSWHRAVVEAAADGRTTVRLLDWNTSETAELGRLRPLEPALCQATALGVQFGLLGVSETECPEGDLDFYRKKLVNREFLLEEKGTVEGMPQVRLHLLSDTNSYCFNDKMLSRLASCEWSGAAGRVPHAPLRPTTAVRSQAQRRTGEGGRSAALRARQGAAGDQGSVPVVPAEAGERPLFLPDMPDPPVRVGDTYLVLVSQVVSAGLFYGLLLTEENSAALCRLEADLQLLAELPQQQPLPCPEPRAGQLVITRCTETAERWCRAAVLEPSGPAVLVRLLDYGTQQRVPADGLLQLPAELAAVPATALLLGLRGAERLSAAQQRLAEKVLDGSGEEVPLELTVASVGRAGAATVVSCADLDGRLAVPDV